MPIAIALTLDPVACDLISALWQRLASAGLSDRMPRLGYPPHVTLGLYEDLDPAAAKAALPALAQGFAGLTFRFHGLAVFPGAENVLWLAPLPDPALLALQADLQRALAAESHPHTRAGDWLPHCTLATDLSGTQLQAALGLLTPEWRPIESRAASLDLLRFEPVELLWRAELAA